MSIRFHVTQEQSEWIFKNISEDLFHYSVFGYVDFLDEEDANMFILRFGTTKSSTKIERMIARETLLEEWEKNCGKF